MGERRRGREPGGDWEAEYQLDLGDEKIRSATQTSVLAAALYAAFGVLDLWAIPSALHVVWGIRLVVIALCAGVVVLLRWRRATFVRHYALIIGTEYLVLGLGIALMVILARPTDLAWYLYYAGLILVAIALYAWTYLSVALTLSLGGSYIGLYVAIAIEVQHLHASRSWPILISNCFFLVGANIIGLFAQRLRDRFSRQSYALKRALTEEKERIRALVEHQDETILVLDGATNCRYASQAVERVLGYSVDEFLRLRFAELVHPEDAPVVRAAMERSLGAPGAPIPLTTRCRHADGTWRTVACVGTNYLGERAVGGIIVNFHDITHRVHAEEELRRAKEQAETATRLKDKYVSLVSHDLKGPITAIKMLMVYGGGASADAGAKAATIAEGLLAMIDTLLDIGRLQTGTLPLMKRLLRPRAVVDDLLKSAGVMAAGKQIGLSNELAAEMQLLADEGLFRTAVQSLVTNAVKFTPPGGSVRIFSGGDGVISVADTGTGVPPDLVPRLFSAEVGKSTLGTAGERGTGLGLPYCYEIMKAHGGEIECDTASTGSTFHLRFPPPRPVVLVVDDQPVERRLIGDEVRRLAAVDVLEAEDGLQALEILRVARPRLVITDLKMPRMDGLELLKRIRAEHAAAGLPVVVNTALGPDEALGAGEGGVRSAALALGADDFISKPLDPREFGRRVGRFLA